MVAANMALIPQRFSHRVLPPLSLKAEANALKPVGVVGTSHANLEKLPGNWIFAESNQVGEIKAIRDVAPRASFCALQRRFAATLFLRYFPYHTEIPGCCAPLPSPTQQGDSKPL